MLGRGSLRRALSGISGRRSLSVGGGELRGQLGHDPLATAGWVLGFRAGALYPLAGKPKNLRVSAGADSATEVWAASGGRTPGYASVQSAGHIRG